MAIQLTEGVTNCPQVVEASPYLPTPENTLDKYNCDFCVHGGKCMLNLVVKCYRQ